MNVPRGYYQSSGAYFTLRFAQTEDYVSRRFAMGYMRSFRRKNRTDPYPAFVLRWIPDTSEGSGRGWRSVGFRCRQRPCAEGD